MKTRSLVIIGILVLACLAYLFFHFGSDDPRLTQIGIQNNSSSQAKVVVKYSAHESCSDICTLNLGNLAINEQRSTSFVTSGEGSFEVFVQLQDGRRLVTDNYYTEGWKFNVNIYNEAVNVNAPLAVSKNFEYIPADKEIYKNSKYQYSFVYPKTVEISEEKEFTNGSKLSQQNTSLYLGGSANLAINVFVKGQSESDRHDPAKIAMDPSFKKITIDNKDAWESASYGTANHWFVKTIFFGDKYVYELEFSNDSKAQNYLDLQDDVMKSFKFY